MTICEKILSRAAGVSAARPGDYLWPRIDGTAIIGGEVLKRLSELGVERFFDPERVYITEDHFAPASSISSANSSVAMRQLVKKYHVKHFFEWGRHGVSHELFPDHGYVTPGDLIVSIDSHSTSYGCFNAASCSINEELPYVLQSGSVWLKVPPTLRIEFDGVLPGPERFVVGKDVILHIAGRGGADFGLYKALEFSGTGLASISMPGRFSIANMSADLGAKFAIFSYDEKTKDYLQGKLVRDARPVAADPDAVYEGEYSICLSTLAPYVALPHDSALAVPVTEILPQRIKVQQAFLGSCTNGRMEDFRMAARILKGRKIAPTVRLIATPASQAIWQQCLAEGIWEIFAQAEAVITNTTCGACAGVHLGLLGDGEVCISSSNRNFRGRMGSTSSSVYLANPATVAASAVSGYVCDPREFL